MRCVFVAIMMSAIAGSATAEGAWAGYSYAGQGRLLNNDFFGDGHDRWRTGSYLLGLGYENPQAPAAISSLELRLRGESIAPRGVTGSMATDRAYAGIWSMGLHSHLRSSDVDLSFGADLVVVGPQTGILELQESLHDILGAQQIDQTVSDNQVVNGVFPTVTAELGHDFVVGKGVAVRPFGEASYGVEDFLRVGVDVSIGDTAQDVVYGRDPVTGQRYKIGESDQTGFGVVLGADYAYVDDSEYFPSDFGTTMKNERLRARAGVAWQFTPDMSAYYGITYLSEEYEGQSEGQFVGSLKLNLNF
ncbi:hypothetical protein BVC71_10565 [Marivivens niveibacter]|uniref:DUF2219 domain-containing protein n=2 Tax=Marivivens niveibacter TaxID=1930667 RepID=A0A251WXC3_9RHOB|nr:hypothetical protein BVC71_10565 [Marivivens niveibacter]